MKCPICKKEIKEEESCIFIPDNDYIEDKYDKNKHYKEVLAHKECIK